MRMRQGKRRKKNSPLSLNHLMGLRLSSLTDIVIVTWHNGLINEDDSARKQSLMKAASKTSDKNTSPDEAAADYSTSKDELFFDQLKDQFAFFYALTMVAMYAYKQARKARQQEIEADDTAKL